MKIPDFLKNRIAIVAVSLICTALGIAGYDFTIHEGQALGIAPPSEQSQVVSDDAIGEITYTPGKTYRFRVEGGVILAHNLELAATMPNVAVCGCSAVVPIPYFLTQTVEVPRPLPTKDLLSRVMLPESLRKYYMIGEWLPGAKVTYLGIAPDVPLPGEKE